MARKQVREKSVLSGGAAAVPARRKSTTNTRVVRPVASVEVAGRSEPAAEVAALANPAVTVSSVTAPSSDAIARLAYSFWEARGYQGGSSEEDWLRAESQLSAK